MLDLANSTVVRSHGVLIALVPNRGSIRFGSEPLVLQELTVLLFAHQPHIPLSVSPHEILLAGLLQLLVASSVLLVDRLASSPDVMRSVQPSLGKVGSV